MAERNLLYAECVAYAPSEVRINDVAIIRMDGGGEEYRAFVPLPAYVTAGTNELSIHIAPGFQPPPPPPPPAPGEPAPRPKIWAQARVAFFADEEPAFERAGDMLGEVVFVQPFTSRVKSTTFQSPIGPREWAWSRCEPLSLTEETRQSALEFLQPLQAAFLAGDPGPVIDAAGPRIQDMARAFDFTPAQVVEMMSNAITQGVPYSPAPPAPFAPRISAQNRLLDCVGADGIPFIRAFEGQPRELGYLTAVIGRIGGRWQIVR